MTTRGDLLEELVRAAPGHQSAVIADWSADLGSLQAVYNLLDGQEPKG
jgi:hypothetical protein